MESVPRIESTGCPMWASSCTQTGKRQRNEDFIRIDRIIEGESGSECLLFLLCDGMGGGVAGDRASVVAARTFCASIRERFADLTTEHDWKRALVAATESAHQKVLSLGESLEGKAGTTLTAVVLPSNFSQGSFRAGWIVHVGDSRCYRRGPSGNWEVLTSDHSLTGEMVRAGYITLDEVSDTAGNNVLTQCIGDAENEMHPELLDVHINSGEILLLCSDGVWGVLHGSTVFEDAISRSSRGTNPAETLVRGALEMGSDDNCSALMIAP